jgi:hypothetical protein
MRKRGAAVAIPWEYQGATSPVVSLKILYLPGNHVAELLAYARYLVKHGKGPDGGKSEYFGRVDGAVDIEALIGRVLRAA